MKILPIISLFIFSISSFAHEVDLHRLALFTIGGAPVAQENGPNFHILVNQGYAVGYSEDMKQPVWAVYRWGNVGSGVPVKWERPPRFLVDSRTVAKVHHDDYTGSGYDRGHMAPNSGMTKNYGQMAQLETYFMSNICPQKPNLNRQSWKRLEDWVRDKFSEITVDNDTYINNAWVITAPIFDDDPVEVIEGSGIPIPTRFYKIIAAQIGYSDAVRSVSFIMPQDIESSAKYEDYIVSVDEIEAATGLEFYPELSVGKQRNLEGVTRSFNIEEVKFEEVEE